MKGTKIERAFLKAVKSWTISRPLTFKGNLHTTFCLDFHEGSLFI